MKRLLFLALWGWFFGCSNQHQSSPLQSRESTVDSARSPQVDGALKLNNQFAIIRTLDQGIIAYHADTLEPLRTLVPQTVTMGADGGAICASPSGTLVAYPNSSNWGPYVFNGALDEIGRRNETSSIFSCAISEDGSTLARNGIYGFGLFSLPGNTYRGGTKFNIPGSRYPGMQFARVPGQPVNMLSSRVNRVDHSNGQSEREFIVFRTDLDANQVDEIGRLVSSFDSGEKEDPRWTTHSWNQSMNESGTVLSISNGTFLRGDDSSGVTRVRVTEYEIVSGRLTSHTYAPAPAGAYYLGSGFQGDEFVAFYQENMDGRLTVNRYSLPSGNKHSVDLSRLGSSVNVTGVLVSPFGDQRVLIQTSNSGTLVWNFASDSIGFLKGAP